ncbi:hypothetical protein [Streptomyces viridochromogenes]|uniref:hypothetical protein n=1 Tax=Streptomyces viridochromogenes TaxID=1938 RepID=UPI0009974AFA|nr:hypothetical protein [Streptomyces viridochromogenes]
MRARADGGEYAVTAGGGHNHRLELAAMVLLKENHIAAAGGVTAAIEVQLLR